MLDDNKVFEYNRAALAMVSITHHKGGLQVIGDDFYNLAPEDNPADINWPALVGSLIGVAFLLLQETDDPEAVLQDLGLTFAMIEAGVENDDE